MTDFSVEFMMHMPGDDRPTPVSIREDELSSLTAADLTMLHISRKKILYRVFAEARELMRGVKPGDRMRPCAEEALDGDFHVILVRYSAHCDPLMQGPTAGRT